MTLELEPLERIGIFGGTFDPIHNAHLAIALAALEAGKLDRVCFVVAARPPHKRTETHAGAEDRLAMVRAAVDGDSRLEASDIELARDGYSYTVDTIEEIQRRHPGAELFLVIGYDSLIDLPRWRRPDRIAASCRLLVAPRPRMTERPAAELAGRYEMLPFKETALSSTEIRRRVAGGESIEGLVPAGVERIIRAKGIYQDADRRQPAV
jgi:nicotinate-nucleotide adenylyltransferase